MISFHQFINSSVFLASLGLSLFSYIGEKLQYLFVAAHARAKQSPPTAMRKLFVINHLHSCLAGRDLKLQLSH